MGRHRLSPIVIGFLLALGACGAGPTGAAGYPPLPGPAAGAEVVDVSSDIATVARPVDYYRDSADVNRLNAYDWTGDLRGSVEVTANAPYSAYPSPDGTRILLAGAHVVSGGRSLGKLAVGTWAGDDEHICGFRNEKGGPGAPRVRSISSTESQGLDTPAWLFEQAVGGPSKRLMQYGAFASHGGPEVLSCDAPADRVVVGQTFVAHQSGIELLRLSDGRVLYQLAPPHSAQPDGVVVAADGALLAEGSTASLSTGTGNSFTVLRIPQGTTVAHVSGGGVVAFSGDDTRVLTVEYLNGGNQSGRYQVVDLATSRVTWTATLSPGTHVTRLGSGDFLVASRTYAPSTSRPGGNDPFEDVWIVPASGPARLVLKHAIPLE